VRSLAVVEAYVTVDGVLSWSGLAESPGVETLLVQCAIGAFDLAVLLGLAYRDELVANALSSERLLEGVGLLHMGEENVGELCAMVGLDLLNGKGEAT